ncbi:MAG: glutamate-5-semialdehyde dehydrogenase [Acidobacteriota bacterium]
MTSLSTPVQPATQTFDATSVATRVRQAQRRFGAATASQRTAVLNTLSTLLDARRNHILEANQRDLDTAETGGLELPLRKRLRLDHAKLDVLRAGVDQLAALADPVGRTLRRTLLDDGLELRQVQSPLGVLLIIFESRPDAVIQIGSLALRAGDAVILKGGSEARHSNRVLVDCLRDALAAHDLPIETVVGVEERSSISALLDQDQHIDLVIPRGSGELVRTIQNSTRIPVLGHAEGVCHLYVDRDADRAMAVRLTIDGKCDYPAACNATETVLVHRDFLPHLAGMCHTLREAGIDLRCDTESRAVAPWAEPATEEDWRKEYGDLTLSIRVVDDLDQAIEHIHQHGSAHTDAIVTKNQATGEAFLARVDSASVFWNASTRFADGFRYGLGAEVGIATGRIHARGPVGIDGLLTTRWLLHGHGQTAGAYGPGKQSFLHRSLPLEEDDS